MNNITKKLVSFSNIIKKSNTTTDDLYKILKEIDMKDVKIDWSYNFNKNIPYMILNLGNIGIGGTHWVAVDNKHKIYFDSLGASPPSYIPDDYQYNNVQIQDYNFGHCGQYACMFLYYSKNGEVDRFYNLFDIANM